jgi:AmmeMemoRadiSam system protein A
MAMRACFVTLTKGGKLRGCIGSPAPKRSLIEDVTMNAAQAGLADPRFPALTEAELQGLTIDISILSHPRALAATRVDELIAQLEPDRDGVILGVGRQRALFLPSVWRQVADAGQFVRHLLLKAGLDARGWPNGLEAHRFRVESFGAPWRPASASDIAPVRIEEARTLH